MIDITDGMVDFGDGKVIYHGMTKEEFFESKIYKEELFCEKDKDNKEINIYPLKNQKLYGKEVRILVHFGLGYVEKVEIDCPEMSNYLEWPDDYDYHMNMFAYMNRYNHEILEKAFNTQIREGEPTSLSVWDEWGRIGSTYDIRIPHIAIVIRYRNRKFRKNKNEV